MANYLIIGAGAIGSALAEELASGHHQVSVVSRRGSTSSNPFITSVSADASDADRVTQLATDCDAIFNCANPAYHRWPTDWPPIANALLTAAEHSGAVLVTMSNLYPYGPPTGPMTPDSPFNATYEKALVRATMWRDARSAHDAGRLRATEVRASDYIGPKSQGVMGQRAIPRVLAGKSCQVLGNLDVPHSWSYTVDVARTLVACAQNSEAWGRAWHVPTNVARTQRQVIDDVADAAGVSRVKISSISPFVLRVMGLFSPVIRELPTTIYQFTAPFVIDDTATRQNLRLEPTPWDVVLKATIAALTSAR